MKKQPHYNQGKIEVIDIINDRNLNFNLGNVIKYILRCDHKGNKVEDLKKAKAYIDYELEREDLLSEQINKRV